jgi:hypothetical protein
MSHPLKAPITKSSSKRRAFELVGTLHEAHNH